MALPVSPEPPEEPLTAPMPLAAPVAPVGPELPETADGAELAPETAGPVAPELVAEDWAVTGPDGPETATGEVVTSTPPPAPPLASPVAEASPPLTVKPWAALFEQVAPVQELDWSTNWVGSAVTEASATGAATPPVPPLPPAASTVTMLAAEPVSPEVALESDAAPELARELASPVVMAVPVSPELPDDPDAAATSLRRAPRGTPGRRPSPSPCSP